MMENVREVSAPSAQDHKREDQFMAVLSTMLRGEASAYYLQKSTGGLFYKIFARNRGTLDVLVVIIFSINYFCIETDLSSTITVSALFEVLAFLPLIHSNSVSPWTLKMYTVVLFIRNAVILYYRGHQPYVPTDLSGKYIFPTLKLLSLVFAVVAHYRSSRPTLINECPFGEARTTGILLTFSCVLGFFFYADLIEFVNGDRLFTVCTLMETFAFIPQVRRVMKYDYSSDDVPFFMSICISQFVSFTFWYLAFAELESYMPNRKITGPLFMFAWLSQLLMSCHMVIMHCLNMLCQRKGSKLYLSRHKQKAEDLMWKEIDRVVDLAC